LQLRAFSNLVNINILCNVGKECFGKIWVGGEALHTLFTLFANNVSELFSYYLGVF